MKHPLIPSFIPIRSLAILAFAAVSPVSVRAATNVTWIGAGADTNWSNSANWATGGVNGFALPGSNSTTGDNYSLFFYSSASGAINSLVDSSGNTGWYYRSLNFYSATGGQDITLSGSDLYSSSGLGNVTTNDNSSTTAITVHIQNNFVSASNLLVFNASSKANLDVSGNITLTAASGTVQLRGASTHSTISGVIGAANGGSVTLWQTAGSAWTVSNSNNRISNAVIGSGTLSLGGNNALGSSPVVTFGQSNNGANTNIYLDLKGYNQTASSLAVVAATAGSNYAHVTNSSALTKSTFTYSNSIANETYGGTIEGNINFVKEGSNNLTLTGTNTYTDATTINGGTLTVNGSLAAGSAVTVTAATLAGSGTANGTVSGNNATINGNGLKLGASTLSGSSTLSGYNIASSMTVASGTTSLTGTTKSTSALLVSIGATLNANGTIDGNAAINGGLLKGNSTVTGNLNLTGGTIARDSSSETTTVNGNFIMDGSSKLVAMVSGTVAGLSYDQVVVKAAVTLAGTLDLSALDGLTLGDKITLIDNTSSNATTGYFSSIIAGGATYTVTGNSDYTFTAGSANYLLSYMSNADGDNQYNDVTLTMVPEPATWAMLVAGIGMLVFGQRVRFRRS